MRGSRIVQPDIEAKQYNDAFKARQELYELMKKAVYITENGYIEDDYTKTVYLDIGEGTLSYDPYYDKLAYGGGEVEQDIAANDFDKVVFFIDQISKCLKQLELKINGIKKEAVRAAFSAPLQFTKENNHDYAERGTSGGNSKETG